MKVLFHMGYPMAWAKGGHALQIEETKRALEAWGCEVRWLHNEDTAAWQADILHYWTRPSHDSHWELARRQGLKIVISEYHQSAVQRPRIIWPMRRALAGGLRLALGRNLYGFFGAGIYRNCDAAIAVTRAEAAYMIDVFGASPARVHCIPNGASEIFFDPSIVPEGTRGLLYIGYICPRKNSVEVAKAAIKAQVPITFVGGAPFGGHDPYVETFTSLVDNRMVAWLGDVSDRRRLAALIRGATGVLLASRDEGLPLCLLEALACGKPVCCSNLPNVRSYFGDAIRYCHPPQSAAFLADLRSFHGACATGLHQPFEVPSWGVVGSQIQAIYQDIAGRSARPVHGQERGTC